MAASRSSISTRIRPTARRSAWPRTATWIGSLSAAYRGTLAGVDETVLPEGTRDGQYLHALDALLARMPASDLAFVIAGGDVLAGDAMGKLGMTLDGTYDRDRSCTEACSPKTCSSARAAEDRADSSRF